MAKSDTPFGDLDKSKAYSPPHKPAYAEDTDINGFDTETADGGIFMLSIAWEGYGPLTVDNGGDFLTSKQVWKYLTHKRARSSLNMWYNLNFDANVLLRNVLSEKQLAILNTTASVSTEKYDIMFIPGKFLKIRDSNRNVYIHYDAAQFFYTSLENAAKEWLNQDKLSETVDVTNFGEENGGINQYIRDNWRKIEKYARVDAELVRDLWKEAVRVGENLQIPMGRPFSTGYLAESYLNAHLREKPGIGPKEVAEIAWQSYAGGRFEVFKRGNVGEVAGPDINSAYPWVLASLPDPKTLEWQRYTGNDIEKIENADYGFVKAKVSTNSSRTIQPFAVKDEKLGDVLKYPALDNYVVTTIKDTFTFALNAGYLTDYEIQECWLGYDTGAWYPFDFIDGLYNKRKQFESNGNMKKGMLLKIILNSMYGKTCQTTPKRRKVSEQMELEENEKYVPSLSLPKSLREEYESGFIEWLEAGSWFNPFIASYITGLTRLELHKRVVNYGLEDNTVMMATDCLMIEKDAFDNTTFAEDCVKSGLGNWDYDYSGKAFVIGAGVYQVDTEENGRKIQTRGFKEADLKDGLVSAAEKANGHIEIESMRPQTVGEIIWSNNEVSEIGKFTEQSRKLSPDMDNKRVWQKEASFNSLLNYAHLSKPIQLSG